MTEHRTWPLYLVLTAHAQVLPELGVEVPKPPGLAGVPNAAPPKPFTEDVEAGWAAAEDAGTPKLRPLPKGEDAAPLEEEG